MRTGRHRTKWKCDRGVNTLQSIKFSTEKDKGDTTLREGAEKKGMP